MIVKKTKQLGNFKRGINLYVPKKRSEPSGIPVVSTNAIVLSGLIGGYFSQLNGTYTKSAIPFYGAGTNEPSVVYFKSQTFTGGAAIWFDPYQEGRWRITYDNDNGYQLGESAGNSSTIPIGGYSNTTGYPTVDVGTVTITAA